MNENNLDKNTVDGFGDEWVRLDQTKLSDTESKALFDRYFSIFPWDALPTNAIGFDLGCGSGRWAKLVAPRVGVLHCIDPSIAISVAQSNLSTYDNCKFHKSSVESIPLADRSMDFGYSLGVLHHVPDTQDGLSDCVRKLKPGAPFLLYLYYAFDNKPFWFRGVWRISDMLRRVISQLPHGLRYLASQFIAAVIYIPFALSARLLENAGFNVDNFPLSSYRNTSFYVMRTDALDRFGTRLEQRFTREQIRVMMINAGLEKIVFSEDLPFWCAVGYRTTEMFSQNEETA